MSVNLDSQDRPPSNSHTPKRLVSASKKGTVSTTPYEATKPITTTYENYTPGNIKSTAESCRMGILEELEVLKLTSKPKTMEKVSTKNSLKSNKNSTSTLKDARLKSAFTESKYFDESMSRSVKLPETIYGKAIKKKSDFSAKVAKTKTLLIKKEVEGMQSRPELSDKTKQIIREKLCDQKPLHERLDQIAENKKIELEMLNKKYEEPLFPQNSARYDKDKFQNWIQDKYDWNNKKHYKIVERKLTQEKDELEIVKRLSSITAKQKLNQTYDDPNYESIYERYCMKPWKKIASKKRGTSVFVFKSRKCPNFNTFKGKSSSKAQKDKLVADLTVDKEMHIVNYSTFRHTKSLKGSRKEVPELSNRNSVKTKATSKRKYTFSVGGDEESRFSRWQDTIHMINTFRGVKAKDDLDDLYKINVRQGSAWDNHKENEMYYENNIVYNEKYKRILKNLFE